MKDPPNMRKLRRETERVVQNVLREVGKYDEIGKKEFESILDQIILQIHQNRGIDIEQIASRTRAVVQAFPKEYGQLYLEEVLNRPVDLVLHDAIKPRLKPIIEQEVVYT